MACCKLQSAKRGVMGYSFFFFTRIILLACIACHLYAGVSKIVLWGSFEICKIASNIHIYWPVHALYDNKIVFLQISIWLMFISVRWNIYFYAQTPYIKYYQMIRKITHYYLVVWEYMTRTTLLCFC